MPHSNFNLVTEAWIPVRYLSNPHNCLVSLDTLFTEARQIHDLDCPAHERISLMRLLISSLKLQSDPQKLMKTGMALAAIWQAKLEHTSSGKISSRISIYSAMDRVLQDCTMGASKAYPSGKMVFHYSTGNSPTLLDHAEAPRVN